MRGTGPPRERYVRRESAGQAGNKRETRGAWSASRKGNMATIGSAGRGRSKVAVKVKQSGNAEWVKSAWKALKRHARIRAWWFLAGVLAYGGATCSGKSTTAADGSASWEFAGRVAAGAELLGRARGGPPQEAAAER